MMPVERLLSKIPTKSYDLNTMFHIRMQEKWVSQYEGLESRKKMDIKMKNVDQVMSLEDQQFDNTLQAAWVETHPTNSAETRSGVESPKPTADYTRHVVTVEVHPVPYNKPLKQKVAQKPTTSHVYIGKEHFVCIHSDPKDQPSKRKTPESEMYVKDQKGQKFTADEGISLHKEKPPNQTISQHLPTTTDCTGQLIEEVKEKKSDQKMIESPTVNADYTV